jgi:nitroimidazol reductase NimA-like FMN-containing flavoprotein (pyridoxamine 5'-phosphate oxidase superfamily)
MSTIPVTDNTRIRRRPERAAYDRDVINGIIDEALVCHIGVAVDGQPRVIPTAIIRIDDHVYIHGSPNNQLLTTLAAGAPACIAVTLVDSIVAGRSGFGMSMDYRSVVIFAKAEKITDFDEKERIVAAFVEDIMPGHKVRPPKSKEIAATVFLRFPLSEASAKIRDHGVMDPEEDHSLEGWAGVVPLKLTAGTPRNCGDLRPEISTPEYAKNYSR